MRSKVSCYAIMKTISPSNPRHQSGGECNVEVYGLVYDLGSAISITESLNEGARECRYYYQKVDCINMRAVQ